MPPKEKIQGEVKCLFVQNDGTETEIPSPLLPDVSSPEEMFRDIKEMFRLVRQEHPVPTHIVGEIDCKPKKIKEVMEDLRIQLLAQQQTIEKYRNHKIPRRKRMIRRAYRMRKTQHVYLIANAPMQDIEITFQYDAEKFKELMKQGEEA